MDSNAGRRAQQSFPGDRGFQNAEGLEPVPPAERMHAVHAVAAGQNGYVERSQLVRLGFSDDGIERWRRRGLLTTAARRVYAVGPRDEHTAARVRRARLTAPDQSVLSHGLACEWMDLEVAGDGPLELVIARGQPREQPGVIIRRTRHLPTADVRTTFGVPHTSFARTLYDIASPSPPGELDRLLDRAAKVELLELVDLHRVLGERKRLAGRPALLAAIERLRTATARSRSELERRALRLCAEAGLPQPVLNDLRAGEEVDFSWDWTRGVVELDGFAFHFTPADVAAAARKLEVLRAAGIPVLHVTWFDVTQRPDRTVARIQAFTERHRLPGTRR